VSRGAVLRFQQLTGDDVSATLRSSNIDRLEKGAYDVLVVGGGINGAVAAAALAGRGVRVALIDAGDFAGGVSSNSSNLAWGGIKYLESREFLLVDKLCRSRNELMRAYPSTVREIRFFTTIQKGFRVWSVFVYLGSLLYWLIGRCRTRAPRYLSARTIESLEPEINTVTPPVVSSTRTATSTTTTRASCSASCARRWISAVTR
jgi:glycerol-3-phosphate dehydrogenase